MYGSGVKTGMAIVIIRIRQDREIPRDRIRDRSVLYGEALMLISVIFRHLFAVGMTLPIVIRMSASVSPVLYADFPMREEKK